MDFSVTFFLPPQLAGEERTITGENRWLPAFNDITGCVLGSVCTTSSIL